MKFKKVIAALSAVTMLGSLAVAVPVSAKAVTKTVFKAEPNATQWYAKQNEGDGSWSTTGDSVTLTSNDGNILQVRPEECNSDKSMSVKLTEGVTYHILVEYNANITEFTDTSTKNSVYATFRAMTPKESGQGYEVVNSETKTSVRSDEEVGEKEGQITYDLTPSQDSYLEMQFYLRFCKGTVTYSNITVTYEEEVITPAESVKINTNYTEGYVLYQGESIELSATVTPGDSTDEVVWSIKDENGKTAVNNKNYYGGDDPWFTIADGKLTYNKNDRVGDSGKCTITATAGDQTDKLEIFTQRKRNISCTITDASGDNPTMSVVTKVDGVQVDSLTGTVEYGNAKKTGNSYSGNSTFSMEFTVPEGYALEITKNSGANVDTDGNKVTVSSSTDIKRDFLIEGTLTKSAPKTESKGFTFTDTLTNLVGKTIEVTVNGVTKAGTIPSPETVFTGDSDLALGIIISSIPFGAEVTAVIVD